MIMLTHNDTNVNVTTADRSIKVIASDLQTNT